MTLKTTTNQLDQKRLKLIEDIRTVFDGVTLGDGVGPNEAYAIDDCVDEENEKYYTAKIQDEQFRNKVRDTISYDYFVHWMCFSDEKGFKFVTPICLNYLLTGKKSKELIDTYQIITQFKDIKDFDRIFTKEQILIIIECENYLKSQGY